MMGEFKIEIINPHWIKNGDGKDDQCLHGSVFVQIGEEIISDGKSRSWTISATGLFLLRSLSGGYEPGMYGNYLLPCCGFNIWKIEGFEKVQICGCPNGLDWNIEINGNYVRHWTDNGSEAVLEFEKYREIVLSFAEIIEAEYKRSVPKNIPEDLEDRTGVKMFWEEWMELKEKWKKP